MEKEIKSGEEIVETFFEEIENIPEVDTKIAKILYQLYKENKFTDTNISNSLLKLREEENNEN
jgi:hypothetical protein